MNLIKTSSDFVKAIGAVRKKRLRGIICIRQLIAQDGGYYKSTSGQTKAFYKGETYNIWIMGINPAHVMVSIIGDKTGQVFELPNDLFPDYVGQKEVTTVDDYTLTRTTKGELHLVETHLLSLDFVKKVRHFSDNVKCVPTKLMHSNIYDDTANIAHIGWAYMEDQKMLDFFSLDEEVFLDKKEIGSLYLHGIKKGELTDEETIISYSTPGLVFKKKFCITFEDGAIRYNI